MLNEVQKNAQMGTRVHFVLLLCVLVGISLLIVGLREVTKDLPVPEDEFAPKLTPAPQLQIKQTEEAQVSEEKEPFYFYVNGEKVEGTILPVEDSEHIQLDRSEMTFNSGNKPSQESHFEDSVSTVKLN